MSGKKDKKKELEKRGRNVVTRTDSEVKKKTAEEKREKLNPEGNRTQMFIEVQGDDVSNREIFGKKLIPLSGILKNITIRIPEVPFPVALNVVSELDKHRRSDVFQLRPGITKLGEQVDISAGTVLKFSMEFEGEELDEVYISGLLITK